MPSPFPGMDPYLERHWPDVHTRLVTYAADDLNRRLPDDLIARAEERMVIESDVATDRLDTRGIAPDVRVFEAVERIVESGSAGGVALAPFRLIALDEPMTQRSIEIIDTRDDGRLVTVIELISPSNKIGEGLLAFVKKRNDLVAGGVNVVEIDLTRAGNWRRLLGAYCPDDAVAAYRATIRLAGRIGEVFLHPFPMRQPIPAIKVPLRHNEEPAGLALQPLIVAAYENGRYGRSLNYAAACDPPLEDEDCQWAKTLLSAVAGRNC